MSAAVGGVSCAEMRSGGVMCGRSWRSAAFVARIADDWRIARPRRMISDMVSRFCHMRASSGVFFSRDALSSIFKAPSSCNAAGLSQDAFPSGFNAAVEIAMFRVFRGSSPENGGGIRPGMTKVGASWARHVRGSALNASRSARLMAAKLRSKRLCVL